MRFFYFTSYGDTLLCWAVMTLAGLDIQSLARLYGTGWI
jgi:hypothetical protein